MKGTPSVETTDPGIHCPSGIPDHQCWPVRIRRRRLARLRPRPRATQPRQHSYQRIPRCRQKHQRRHQRKDRQRHRRQRQPVQQPQPHRGRWPLWTSRTPRPCSPDYRTPNWTVSATLQFLLGSSPGPRRRPVRSRLNCWNASMTKPSPGCSSQDSWETREHSARRHQPVSGQCSGLSTPER